MNGILKTAVAMIAAAALLNGCAVGASDAVANDQTVSAIQVGVTTQQDVLAKFGEPSNRKTNDKGNSEWYYQRVQNTALAFIPGLNLLGQSEKESELTVRFNSKGIVTGYDHNHRSL